MGISFLPYSGVRHELELGTLSIVPLTEGHKVALPTSVMVRRGQHYSTAVLAFLRVLQEMYEADISMVNEKAQP